MPSFFPQGIVTYTFLVNLAQVPEIDGFLLELEKADEKPDIPDIKDNPQFWAEGAIQIVFGRIIEKTRPQGVIVNLSILDKDSDVPHVAELRRKIENGDKEGQLVTIRLVFTRPAFLRSEAAGPELLPFPGLSWLTSQVPDEPYNGLALIHMAAAQIPSDT